MKKKTQNKLVNNYTILTLFFIFFWIFCVISEIKRLDNDAGLRLENTYSINICRKTTSRLMCNVNSFSQHAELPKAKTPEKAKPASFVSIHQEELRLYKKSLEKAQEIEVKEPEPPIYIHSGDCLTASKGVFNGPSGKETYYNLDMTGVINIMRSLGFSEADYPYWIRDDGVKMLGDFVMVAANLDKYPKGSIVESSLGTAIVCDTGGFASANEIQLDIAVNW